MPIGILVCPLARCRKPEIFSTVGLSVTEFIWPLRVYYEDTDSGGVVYYANYLKFMERARTEWLRSLGFEQDALAREDTVLFVVRSVTIDFLRSARFNDLLEVSTRIARARRASLVFEQKILKVEEPKGLLCYGQVKVACVDAITFRPRPTPRRVLTEILSDN